MVLYLDSVVRSTGRLEADGATIFTMKTQTRSAGSILLGILEETALELTKEAIDTFSLDLLRYSFTLISSPSEMSRYHSSLLI